MRLRVPVSPPAPRTKTKIYYDGRCAMCTAVMGRVRASQKRGEFQLCDMHADRAMPFDKAAVAREMHLVDAEGRVYRGTAAILEILGRYPRWVFLYSFMLAGLALFSWRSEDRVGRQAALNMARLIIALTYVFSGLQKFNWRFVDVEFSVLTSPITDFVPAMAMPLHYVAMAAPVIQLGFGLALLTRRFRRVSLVLAVAMHVFILSMLGPLGQNWNTIVWPWTAAMAAFQ